MKKKKAVSKKESHNSSLTDSVLLIARVVVGGAFVWHGMSKLQNIDGVAHMFGEGGLNLPAPTLMAWLAGLGELVGGAMVLLGFMTKIGAGLLAFIMAVALGTAHGNLFESAEAFKGAGSVLGFLSANLILLGTGGGRFRVWSKDCPCS